MGVEGGSDIILEALDIFAQVPVMVRGRSLLWPENRTTSVSTVSLGSWKDGNFRLGSIPALVSQGCILLRSVPMEFATLNVAGLGPQLSVVYILQVANGTKKIQGNFSNIPLGVDSGRSRMDRSQGSALPGWFDGQVMNPDEFREWVAIRKKTKT